MESCPCGQQKVVIKTAEVSLFPSSLLSATLASSLPIGWSMESASLVMEPEASAGDSLSLFRLCKQEEAFQMPASTTNP